MEREAAYFWGFARPDGRVGIRNHVLILSIVGLVSRAAERIAAALAGSVLVASPYGRGQFGDDKQLHRALLIGLACNPNVAGVLIVGADRLGADDIGGAIAATNKPVRVVCLDDLQADALEVTARGIREGGALMHAASRMRRTLHPASALFVGVECGHSDATSGLVSNPVTGQCVDRLIDRGASAVIGETVEWLGAEHLVARRASDSAVARAIEAAVTTRERQIAATGVDLTGNNPGAENIRGGLSTIEEKSLGAIAKMGTRQIRGLLGMGERPLAPGLYVMDGPSFSPESLTGFAAAGAQLMLFTTGAGNSYCSALAPTIKISGRPETAQRLADQIDFDASSVFLGREGLDAAGARLEALIMEVASGAATWGEVHSEGAETFVRIGPSM